MCVCVGGGGGGIAIKVKERHFLMQSLCAQANLFADTVDLAGWKPENPKKLWFFFKLYLET